jgi:hypothetical protein
VSDSRQEFERILEGYLRSELVPFAVRLGEKLLAEKPLPDALLQLLAERLAPTLQGAPLAVRAWTELLAADVTDVDGWTLFGEALRLCGREVAATLADGFGAALSSSAGAAPAVQPRKLTWALGTALEPASTVTVSGETMPRLFSAISDTLAGLGAPQLAVGLDVQGGVEAWLSSSKLVVGAGALTVFGQAELPALLALALSLGEGGVALRGMGEVPGFTAAAVRAFEAWPASLAFSRVLAQLDDTTRGSDPAKVDVGRVLRKSATFKAVALSALASLGAGA